MRIEFLYLQIHLMCIIILAIIGFTFFLRNKQITQAQKLFLRVCIMLVSVLITNSLMWLLDGELFFLSNELYYVITTIYYCLTIVFSYCWFNYFMYKLNKRNNWTNQWLKNIYILFGLLSIVFILINPLTKLIFVINSANVYQRTALFYMPYICCVIFLIPLFVAYFCGLKNRGEFGDNKNNKIFVLYSLLLIIAGAVQMFSATIHVIWPVATLIALSVFILMQNNLIIADPLTQLNNRRKLDEYLYIKEKNLKNEFLYYILVDLNKFKYINDTYGHNAGDKILVDFADILRLTFHDEKCILARTGGDEFVITGCLDKKPTVLQLMERLNIKVEEYNDNKDNEIKISISMGHAILGDHGDSIEDMMLYADKMMYDHKKRTNHGTR